MTIKIFSVFENDSAHFADWFADIGCEVTVIKTPEELPPFKVGHMLILHGGEDICPSYYGQKANKYVTKRSGPSSRDKAEHAILKKAISETYPIFGICRGAQWLSIMAGGKLFQHVEGHNNGKHLLKIEATDDTEERMMWCNSAHHQQMDLRALPTTKYVTVATHPNKYTTRYGENDLIANSGPYIEDPEIVLFPEINGYACQPHPEWLPFNHSFAQFVLEDFCEKFTFDLGLDNYAEGLEE